ncbi:hypothetical protein [Lactococcus lactis]|uniref:Uncharacterized protein n=1 Tax=Lactococcus lactis TaxID=1358 RepID=A0AAW5TM60_9LACT|nr:hypothetical protein [Lactococcus lactis]MCW2279902.1 hypothetical protein [Lactococcus lactis]
MNLDIKLPCEKAFEAFTDTITFYKRKYGEGNVKIKDDLGNTIIQAKIVKLSKTGDISELIELTCLNIHEKTTIRLIHYSKLNISFEINEE